jgi:quinol monooxygenase YgiN
VIPEIIRYRIPLAQADEFVRAYVRAGEVLEQAPQCLGFELVRSAKDPELFLLTILWTSPEAHLSGFRKSAHFPPFLAQIRPYVANILEMEHYEPTRVSWKREAG